MSKVTSLWGVFHAVYCSFEILNLAAQLAETAGMSSVEALNKESWLKIF